jgi:hypothetical protein
VIPTGPAATRPGRNGHPRRDSRSGHPPARHLITAADLGERLGALVAVRPTPPRGSPPPTNRRPYRHLQDGEWTRLNRNTPVGAGDIGHFCFVGEEAQIGAGSILHTYCMVQGGATLGERVTVSHRESVGARARVGDGSVIGCSLVCERSRVGNDTQVFGDLVHRQLNPTIPWDAPEGGEGSPTLGDQRVRGLGRHNHRRGQHRRWLVHRRRRHQGRPRPPHRHRHQQAPLAKRLDPGSLGESNFLPITAKARPERANVRKSRPNGSFQS